MIEQIKGAGIEKAMLCASGVYSTNAKPSVAEKAWEEGYLYGPYDSYHSAHRPDMKGDNTWDSAQFDWEAYHEGAIVRKNGKPLLGFKKKGHKLSPLYAKKYVKERVGRVTKLVNHTGWFVDCDAFGEVYDDWNEKHETSQEMGANARLERMKWLTEKKGLVVGSEGGAAFAAGAIHFAHGMITPVIGWGDPIFKDKQSKYYVGGWYPENEPGIFFKAVPMPEKYVDLYFNPTVRLPLFQTALHDSVIATHHWGNGTMKYTNTKNTTMLLEVLYNVPPMYHFSQGAFRRQKKSIKEHTDVFKKMHEAAWDQAVTSFEYVSEDRMLQKTKFGDAMTVTANFDEKARDLKDGNLLEGRSVRVVFEKTGEVLEYKPE